MTTVKTLVMAGDLNLCFTDTSVNWGARRETGGMGRAEVPSRRANDPDTSLDGQEDVLSTFDWQPTRKRAMPVPNESPLSQ